MRAILLHVHQFLAYNGFSIINRLDSGISGLDAQTNTWHGCDDLNKHPRRQTNVHHVLSCLDVYADVDDGSVFFAISDMQSEAHHTKNVCCEKLCKYLMKPKVQVIRHITL